MYGYEWGVDLENKLLSSENYNNLFENLLKFIDKKQKEDNIMIRWIDLKSNQLEDKYVKIFLNYLRYFNSSLWVIFLSKGNNISQDLVSKIESFTLENKNNPQQALERIKSVKVDLKINLIEGNKVETQITEIPIHKSNKLCELCKIGIFSIFKKLEDQQQEFLKIKKIIINGKVVNKSEYHKSIRQLDVMTTESELLKLEIDAKVPRKSTEFKVSENDIKNIIQDCKFQLDNVPRKSTEEGYKIKNPELVNPNWICFKCNSISNESQFCYFCFKCFCEKCCKNDQICPNCSKGKLSISTNLNKEIGEIEIICIVCDESFLFKNKNEHSFKWKDHSFSCSALSLGCNAGEMKGEKIVEHETTCPYILQFKFNLIKSSLDKIEKNLI